MLNDNVRALISVAMKTLKIDMDLSRNDLVERMTPVIGGCIKGNDFDGLETAIKSTVNGVGGYDVSPLLALGIEEFYELNEEINRFRVWATKECEPVRFVTMSYESWYGEVLQLSSRVLKSSSMFDNTIAADVIISALIDAAASKEFDRIGELFDLLADLETKRSDDVPGTIVRLRQAIGQ